MTGSPAPLLVVHAVALLEEPQMGARALALIEAGAQLAPLEKRDGFVAVNGPGGALGFVPAAACAPLAHQDLSIIRVSQPVMFYRAPIPGGQFVAGVPDAGGDPLAAGEEVRLLARDGDMLLVQRASGPVGYVRGYDTNAPALLKDTPAHLAVVNPTRLLGISDAGRRRLMVLPEDILLRLGRDRNFLLVQREDGRVGFVPALLGGEETVAGGFDLSMAVLGFAWMMLNWSGIAVAIDQFGLTVGGLGGLAGLLLVLGLVAALWFASPRPALARPFGVGILLTYGLLHLLSAGSLTLWH
ncbi:MAG TPA: hypothetical protein VFS21_28785 [Roseiflexaceae bacterium]|nr:hypothetical protein [Roseiflexaceae bacterium]